MTKKNILSIVVALALVAALAVGATLAFFSDEDTATNTFTMGKVDIDLKESDNGGETWTDDGLTFEKLVPGDTTPKMAKVTVAEDSNDCYIAMTVALECNDYDAETGKGFTDEEKSMLMTAVENAIDADKWTVVLQNDGSLLCIYKEACVAEAEVVLFEEITLPLGDKFVFGNNLAEEEFSLVLNAYAVQADNMEELMEGESGEVSPENFDWYTNMINATPATPAPDPEA